MLDATQLLWTQIAAGVCLLIFAGLAYNLLRLRRQIEASKAWIKTDGDIVASEAKIPMSHTSDDQDDVDAVIRYSYRIDGQTHESDRIKFGGGAMMSRASAEALVARYPVGARIDVYCDPMTRRMQCWSRASRTDSSYACLHGRVRRHRLYFERAGDRRQSACTLTTAFRCLPLRCRSSPFWPQFSPLLRS